MDWLVKLFGGTDMALVGVALGALMFVTLMMFAVVIMADRTTKEIIGKIYIQQRTLMAFLLKEYEEREQVNLADYGTQNTDGTISPPPEPAPVAAVELGELGKPNTVLSDKEIARRKAFGEKMKEGRRAAREAKASNGT